MTPQASATGSQRWSVFGIISVVYIFVYFHRVSTSVIAPDLLVTFDTDATALGLMSSMYFYLYAIEQPLVGHLTDRFGPRKVVGIWTIVAALGCFLFAIAPTIVWAGVGRSLIGIGVGGVFVPGLKAFSQWFQQRNFATVTGLLLACGNGGAIIATTPLAWASRTLGWRGTFWIIGGITLVLALATLLTMKDYGGSNGPGSETEPPQGETSGPSSIAVLRSLRFWVLAAIFFVTFGAFLTFQGLWATPFLMSLLEIPLLEASVLNMLVPIGFILGAPLFGWLQGRLFEDRVNGLIGILSIQSILWAGLTLGPRLLGTQGLIPLLLLVGLSTGALATLMWGIVRATTPPSIMGLTTGLLNPAPFLGVALYQPLTGAILDRAGKMEGIYPPWAYQRAFAVCLFTILVCVGLALVLKRIR